MTTAQITTDQLTVVMDGLFGCETKATPVETPTPIDSPRVVATYNDCDGNFQFAIICELSIANSLGAALTMIPPGAAEDATAEGQVPENIGENTYEVLNICSAVLADYHQHRIVLDKMITPGDAIDDQIVNAIDTAECLIQIQYELERYQPGKISLLKIA